MYQKIYNHHIFITVLFLIVIFAPFIIGILEQDKMISPDEKRMLARMPDIQCSMNSIKEFPSLFDAYYLDHFGLREWLTKSYKRLKFALGDSPSQNVTIGKDGWLFLGSIRKHKNSGGFGDPIGDYRGKNLFSAEEMKLLADYMSVFDFWLKNQQIKYFLVIAPDKHTVYSDKLPDYITKINEYTATDQLVELMHEHTSIPVVDLRKSLIASKNIKQLYYKTDTHWNQNGANIAQYEIMSVIKKIFPGKIHPELFPLNIGKQGGGDLSNFIGIDSFKEISPYPTFKGLCKPKKKVIKKEEIKAEQFMCKKQKLNLLVFGDSFFWGLRPYFARKFRKSTYVDGRLAFRTLEKYLGVAEPDIIIEEWVERRLPFVKKPAYGLIYWWNKKMFYCGRHAVFSDEFDRLHFNEDIRVEHDSKNAIMLQITGRDPIITFPPIAFKDGYQYIVHIKIKSSVCSVLQLFFSINHEDRYSFSEHNSIRTSVQKGKNDIYIALDKNNLSPYIRLDPVRDQGEIEITALTIKELNKDLIWRESLLNRCLCGNVEY